MTGHPVDPDLERQVADFIGGLRQDDRLLADMDERERRTAAVSATTGDAQRVSDHLDETVTARELRRRASLVVRCDDCDGRIVAHVTYVYGRPMLWTAERNGPGIRSWLDRRGPVDVAQCRGRDYVLPRQLLLDELPSPGAKQPAMVRVSHSESDSAVR